MAESTQTLVFKLIIDGKEAQATLDLTKGEFVETGVAATTATEQIKKAYQGLTAEALKQNQVTEGNVESLTAYIKTQNLSVDVIEKTIQVLDTETRTLAVDSEAWKKKMVASTNLKAALGGIIQQQTAYGKANQQTLPGVNSMRMAVQQFGYVLNDSQTFFVNARMGMMGIANNIPMIIQLFQAAKKEAGANASMMKLLTSSITGGGGLIIGINALMLVMQLLPGLFDDTTEAATKQKEEIEKLRTEYEKLTQAQIKRKQTDVQTELSQMTQELGGKYGWRKEFLDALPLGMGKYLASFKEMNDEEKERYENLLNQNQALTEAAAKVGYTKDLENQINQLLEKRETIKDPSALRAFDDWILELKKKQKEAGLDETNWDKEKDKQFKTASEQLELSQSHATRMAEIEGKSDRDILELKKQQLAEQVKLYENYGKDVTALLYELAETEAALQTGKKVKVKSAFDPSGKSSSATGNENEDRNKFLKQFEDDQLKELKIEESIALKRAETFSNAEELKTKIQKYYLTKRTELEEKAQAEQLKFTSDYLGQAAGLFAKHTAAYKVLSVAQVLIDTYASAQSAFKAMAGIPVVGPALGIAAAAAAVLAGIQRANAIEAINIKEIGGFAEGGRLPKGKMGFFEGFHNEVIAPEEDFKTYSTELVKHALADARNYISINQSLNTDLFAVKEEIIALKNTLINGGIKSIAYYDNSEVKKIRRLGSSLYRRSKV